MAPIPSARRPATRLAAPSRAVLVLGALIGLLAPIALALHTRLDYGVDRWFVSYAGDVLPASRTLLLEGVGPVELAVSAEGLGVVVLLALVGILALVGTRAAAPAGLAVGALLLGMGALGVVRFGVPDVATGWTALMLYYLVPGVVLLAGGIVGLVVRGPVRPSA